MAARSLSGTCMGKTLPVRPVRLRALCTLACLLCSAWLTAAGQTGKLSPWLRQLSRPQTLPGAFRSPATKGQHVCAFIRTTDEDVLRENGCRTLARYGSLYIADIPIDRLRTMAADRRVGRIEARPSGRLLTDSMAIHLNATQIYSGQGLPQAFTGRGVVMGIMDIGFDLTQPNFYNADATEYRIRAFWDMLSADTVGSRHYVGRDYTCTDEMLAIGHSRDGADQGHGTHTLGIAAGSGAGSKYVGMAPESDICLVANAVTQDMVYIDSADIYKYTFATDALGFKYIFDYAESQGKPCVISFSEGSRQDFWGYDQLYYEMLDSLVGPGRIIVAAAGNNGTDLTWFGKPAGQPSAGVFIASQSGDMTVTLKADSDFDLRLVSYTAQGDTLTIPVRDVLLQPDSTLAVAFANADKQLFDVLVEAYPCCYDAAETCYDVSIHAERNIGMAPAMSLEAVGPGASVEGYRVNGSFVSNAINPRLGGECTRSVLSPGSAPCVICVGATAYRTGIVNNLGEHKEYVGGPYGQRAVMSSMGPSFDGRTKPDVMAPGINIISSCNSFFMAEHPEAWAMSMNTELFSFNGRTYAWNCDSGTSMASPAVGGAVALWLQACPTLTPADVMDIISRTARHNVPSLNYPNNEYGYGEIDVYAGLLDILGASGIKGLSRKQTAARLVPETDGQWLLRLDQTSAADLHLRFYNLGGKAEAELTLPQGEQQYRFRLPQLRRGTVYAVQISGCRAAEGSTLVRP